MSFLGALTAAIKPKRQLSRKSPRDANEMSCEQSFRTATSYDETWLTLIEPHSGSSKKFESDFENLPPEIIHVIFDLVSSHPQMQEYVTPLTFSLDPFPRS